MVRMSKADNNYDLSVLEVVILRKDEHTQNEGWAGKQSKIPIDR